jgi:hypothetical protein
MSAAGAASSAWPGLLMPDIATIKTIALRAMTSAGRLNMKYAAVAFFYSDQLKRQLWRHCGVRRTAPPGNRRLPQTSPHPLLSRCL